MSIRNSSLSKKPRVEAGWRRTSPHHGRRNYWRWEINFGLVSTLNGCLDLDTGVNHEALFNQVGDSMCNNVNVWFWQKQPAAPTKPTRTKAAAKSRLAAVKAALKAKHQAIEAERAAKDAGNAEEKGCLNSEEPPIQADGGLFKVESPAKHSGEGGLILYIGVNLFFWGGVLYIWAGVFLWSDRLIFLSTGLVRRTSRLSAAVVPQASPSSISLTPRRFTQQPLALAQTSAGASSPLPVIHNPHHCLPLAQTPSQASQLHCGNPDSCQKEKDTVNVSSCFTPVKQVLSDETQPGDSMVQSETVSTQGNAGTLPELGMVDSLPPISIAEEKTELAEAIHLDTCPFSTCVTSSQPSISSHFAVQIPVGTQDSFCRSPSSPLVEVMLLGIFVHKSLFIYLKII